MPLDTLLTSFELLLYHHTRKTSVAWDIKNAIVYLVGTTKWSPFCLETAAVVEQSVVEHWVIFCTDEIIISIISLLAHFQN